MPALTCRPVTAITDRLFNCGIPVFMLHRITQENESNIGKITSSHLHNCLAYLADNGYTFISLEKLILALKQNQKLPPRSVVFTMDDGYLDQAEIAAPIFLEYNCPVTFFVITGMLDHKVWPWDIQVSWIIESSKKSFLESCPSIKSLNLTLDKNISKRVLRRSVQESLKKLDPSAISEMIQWLSADAGVTTPADPLHCYQPMTWDLARRLEEQGICFAPHSVSHNILSRLDYELMEKEIEDSWLTIKKELNSPLKVFCYPNGSSADFGKREIEVIKNNGYMGAMSTRADVIKYKVTSDDQIFSLPRLALPNNMTDLIQYCSWMECIRGARYKVRIHP